MIWLSVLIIFIVVMLVYGYLSHHHLVTTNYSINCEKIKNSYTIVLLSDLHCYTHGYRDGVYNVKILDRIDKIKPDFILAPGDMVTKRLPSNDERVMRVARFMRELNKKYPVYYSPGNHEIRLVDPEEYVKEIKSYGIEYLANKNAELKTDNIKIYGLDIPIEWYRTKEKLSTEAVGAFLQNEHADETCYNILMAHDPRHFEAYAGWGADLTVSGHIHGGILRLPFFGGVFSPYLRLFPKYDAGVFDKDGKKMVVGRGLGSHHLKFRWFNPPEIVVIHLNK